MVSTKDPHLLEAVKKMNHCCGPFARMRLETRAMAYSLLEKHNAEYNNFHYPDLERNRYLIQILASDKAEFVKKEMIKEYEEKEKA